MRDEITTFYQSNIDKLYQDENFKKGIVNSVIAKRHQHETDDRIIFDKVFAAYLEEAKISVSLLEGYDLNKTTPMLEVGGGLALTYVFLKKQGYNIWALEPSDSGFNNYFDSGKELCRVMDIDDSNWYNYLGEDAYKIGQQFDFIFSNNVLEHIPKLDITIAGLKRVLNDNGIMVHNTVNYYVPYEPHFGIALIPFFPRATEKVKSGLKDNEMWKGLNFITTSSLTKLSNNLGLKIKFRKNVFYNTLNRALNDPGFANRHQGLIPIVKFLKVTRLINLFKILPISMTTPIIFTLKK